LADDLSGAILNDDYTKALDKPFASREWRVARARSHASQYYHMTRCWEEFLDLEHRHQFEYDYFIRLRDDAFVFAAFDSSVNDQLLAASKNFAIFPNCENFGGLNDKAAVVNRLAARDYFLAPLDYLYLHWDVIVNAEKGLNNTITRKSLNPETFISYCYKQRGIQIIQPDSGIPVITSSAVPLGTLPSHPNNSWCLRPLTTSCYYGHFPEHAKHLKSVLCRGH
jgi:hypothetical protein